MDLPQTRTLLLNLERGALRVTLVQKRRPKWAIQGDRSLERAQ